MKQQVIVIHGGNCFLTYEDYFESLKREDASLEDLRKIGWKQKMPERLGSNFDVLVFKMPNKENAKYPEWKIWFEKFIPLFENNTIFVGHSLGGIFLAKYLSENNYPKNIKATFLVAAPYDDKGLPEPLGDFILAKDLTLFGNQTQELYVYQSKDDPVVPASHAEKFKQAIPKTQITYFEDRGHFSQEELPELVEAIKKVA